MNKCDFCRYGPCHGPCGYKGSNACLEATERYMKVVMSKNNRTTTHNKNVNVHKNTHHSGNKGGKKR